MTLSNIHTVRDKAGVARCYLRVKGHPLLRLPDLPIDDPDFIAAWAEGMRRLKGRAARPVHGSIAQLCTAFLKSPGFLTKSSGYQDVLRRHVCAIEAKAGNATAGHLLPRHISADLAQLAPSVAQARFKAWRAMSAYGVAVGILSTDPTEGVKRPVLPPTKGHPAWSRDDVEAFRRRWSTGTVQRALFELLYWTGARIGDAVRIGPGMVDRDGVLRFRQQKTGGEAFVPWTCNLPAYAVQMEPDRAMMHAALVACGGQMTFLATRTGRTRSAKAIGNDVSGAARLAGVQKSAHGLRKARATVLAEAGASPHQIGAWTGHESLAEIAHYTRSVERRNAVMGTEREENIVKPPTQLENSGK